LIHKYHKISKRKEFLLEEMMEEYKQIEKELNEQDSDEDDNLDFDDDKKTFRDVTLRSQTGGGLLS
jgi:molybdenum-dependent DNA-binding transcriptional regulator ModE